MSIGITICALTGAVFFRAALAITLPLNRLGNNPLLACSAFVLNRSGYGLERFQLGGAGCWYDNEDGSSRQLELAECRPGDPLDLVRQPDNPHDPLAVAIMTDSGTFVGFLKRDRAAWIAPKLDRGYLVLAIVERVKGLGLDGATLGLVMRLNMDGEEPELPTIATRRAAA